MKKLRAITCLIGIAILVNLAVACAAAKTPENVTVTFTANLDCSIAGPKNLHPGENTIDMIGNIKNGTKIGLAVGTLDPGKTIKDLQALTSTMQPGWFTMITFLESASDGTIYPQTLTIPSASTAGPVYFVCFTSLPETKIGELGPFEVKD